VLVLEILFLAALAALAIPAVVSSPLLAADHARSDGAPAGSAHIASLLIETKTRLAQRLFCFVLKLLAMHFLTFTHQIPLLWTHLHPALGVSAE
jgi:hypothetical protein